ncbi:hypothetical protein ACJJTC_004280 [Scirpophaga incertulas]
MAKNDFEERLRLTKYSLLATGIRMNKGNETASCRFFYKFLYYFNTFWLHTDVLAEFNYIVGAILAGKDFIEISLAIPTTTICLLATAKSIVLFLNMDIVIKLVDKLRSIHPDLNDDTNLHDNSIKGKEAELNREDDTRSQQPHMNIQRQIVIESTTLLKFIVLLQYYIFVVVAVSFPLMPVISMIDEYLKKGVIEYQYPYFTKYFFETSNALIWPFVYLHHVWSTFIVALSVFGSDTLYYAACIYIQMHFRILCHRFENSVSSSPEQTKWVLAKAIKRHQELMDLVNMAETLYSKSSLFNIIISSVLICISGFIIMMVRDVGVTIPFGMFLLMNLSQISLLCLFGDMLLKASTDVSSAIFNSKWYDSDQTIKRMVYIILIRAQRPCKLTACKFSDLNLTAFTTILSRSWSYFALLKTIYK